MAVLGQAQQFPELDSLFLAALPTPRLVSFDIQSGRSKMELHNIPSAYLNELVQLS